MCSLPQPEVIIKGNAPDDMQKLVTFILHGVTHIFDGDMELQPAFFGTYDYGNRMAVIDPRGVPYDELGNTLKEVIAEKGIEMIGCLSEAWKLPEDKLEDFFRSGGDIEDHPDKYDIVVVSVETPQGVWLADARIDTVKGKRTLPAKITFDRVPDGKIPHPGFISVMVPQPPVGAYLH